MQSMTITYRQLQFAEISFEINQNNFERIRVVSNSTSNFTKAFQQF